MCISAKDVRTECDDSSNYVEIGNESDLNQPFEQKMDKDQFKTDRYFLCRDFNGKPQA